MDSLEILELGWRKGEGGPKKGIGIFQRNGRLKPNNLPSFNHFGQDNWLKKNKSGWLKLFYRPPVWLLKWCSANQFFNINENMCPYLPKRYLESISVINFLHQWYQHLKKAFDHCYRVASFIAKFYRHKFHSILGKLKVLGKQFFSKVTTPVNS